ncbi:uncharacterized protein LOC143294127 [Babylonia areolata]|uniref:uncharacterized protein LOC143294127 n=1 Tax=Babylonia areolata TaxID=304850 RepID=UPI003FCF5631
MKYDFSHVTSSPYCPKANGAAERAVQTVKNLMKKTEDPYLALLTYRATPLQHGLSPAELLMGRKLRTRIPTLPSCFAEGEGREEFRAKDAELKKKQKKDYDHAHRTRPSSELASGQPVWVKPAMTPGRVINTLPNRTYQVDTPRGHQRRNRIHLIPRDPNPERPKPVPRKLSTLFPKSLGADPVPDPVPDPSLSHHLSPEVPSRSPRTSQYLRRPQSAPASPDVKRSRSGRPIKTPQKLNL